MRDVKDNKLKEHIKDIAAEFLGREAGPNSLITVTDVALNENNSVATVFVTVLPETKIPAALGFIKRNRGEFREYFKAKSKLHHVPHFDFEIRPWSASA